MALRLSAVVLCLGLCLACVRRAGAEEPAPKKRFVLPAAFHVDMPNVVAPTAGGNQLWEDEVYYGHWRIQRNVVTMHCRLLDPHDIRYESGSLEACQRRLEELKRELGLQPTRGKVIVVLHGLMGSRLIMVPLVKYLEHDGEYTVLSVTYASTRAPVSAHARALAGLMASLSEASEINFVAHSLGNLVVRHYLADCEAAGREIDPRIKRFVMIGPPNHGARMAVLLGRNPIFDNTLGLSAQQLGHRWEELAPHLATPQFEFGVIAGGKGNKTGVSPFLAGDDDGTVRVAEARLAGASDFTIVDVNHLLMTLSPTVLDRTLRYVKEGRFLAEGEPRPILTDNPTPPTVSPNAPATLFPPPAPSPTTTTTPTTDPRRKIQ